MNLVNIHNKVNEIAPIHGLDSSGKIDFKDEATNSQKNEAHTYFSQYLGSPSHPLRVSELKEEAAVMAEGHIARYFSEMRLVEMLDLKNDLKENGVYEGSKLEAVRGWLSQISTHALTDFEALDFNQFGEPPYTYLEVITEFAS